MSGLNIYPLYDDSIYIKSVIIELACEFDRGENDFLCNMNLYLWYTYIFWPQYFDLYVSKLILVHSTYKSHGRDPTTVLLGR